MPLLGTKTPSASVGDVPAGDGRAARSLLSCALWRGMGRLWRGMGGMGRPEPLSAQRPHQQQGLSGFHATRDPRHGYCQARGASRREFRGVHESRDTKHESQLLCFPTHDFPAFPSISRPPHPPGQGSAHRSHLQYDRLGFHDTRDTNHGLYRRPVTAFLRVVVQHGAAMARHGRHGAPQAAIRATSAPATGPFGFSRNPRPEARLLPGAPRGVPSGPARIPRFSRVTKHESRPLCPVHHCSRLFTIVRYCSAKNIVQAGTARHSSRRLQAAAAAANPR